MKKPNFTETFKTEKPIIGMVHLPPLPGSPEYDRDGGIPKIIEYAVEDARRLEAGGIDALQIENQFDKPFSLPEDIGNEVVAVVTAAATEVIRAVSVPTGVNIHLNGAEQALAVALAVGARWIRVFALANAYISTSGYVQAAGPQLLRYQREIGAEHILILGDFHVKHGSHSLIADRPLVEQALDAEEAGADVIIATGFKTGVAPDAENIREVRAGVNVPIFLGSGLSVMNAKTLLPVIDGAIVGSTFKEDGKITQPVDTKRVQRFMDTIRRLRDE